MAALPHISSPELLVFVDEAIKLCKAEEAKLTEKIRQCRDILRSMTVLVNISGTDEASSSEVKEEDISPKEQQEIELLERVLKKALKVRSSSAVPRNLGADLEEKKPPKTVHTSQSKVAIKNTVKDADKMRPCKLPSSTEVQGNARRGGSLKGVAVRGPPHTQPVLVKRRQSAQPTGRKTVLSSRPSSVQILGAEKVRKKSCQPAAPLKDTHNEKIIVPPPSEDKEVLKTESQVSPLREQWVPSPWLPLWSAQRAKNNSLWSKVLTRHSKPVPERTHFKERVTSTFQMGQPSGHSAARGAELDTLTQLGLDLIHCYHAVLQSRQPSGQGKDPETLKREYESLLMLEGLEGMMAKTIKHADRLKTEQERKVSWSPCPLQKRGQWGDPEESCLPPMLLYSTEHELKELNTLRLRVDQLQLEIHLHQAMSDTLAHHLTPQQSKRPSAAALRGLYSLLGEGGTHFPALVLDSNPDQTQSRFAAQ